MEEERGCAVVGQGRRKKKEERKRKKRRRKEKGADIMKGVYVEEKKGERKRK